MVNIDGTDFLYNSMEKRPRKEIMEALLLTDLFCDCAIHTAEQFASVEEWLCTISNRFSKNA